MKKNLFIFILVSICISFLNSTIINIPADQPTIQQGIDIALNGDIVLIQSGTYFENINFNGKNITVASLFLTTQDTTYISNTIIDGGQPLNPECASVVTFENSEDENAILTGLTIKNGSGNYADPDGNGYYHYQGGGIYCINSNPNLENLQISENTVETMGAGIYCYNSNPNLENLTILNNSAEWSGGGIFCQENSNINIINVIIFNNSSGSSGGGIYFHSGSNSLLQDVVISGNTAESSGGGICSYSSNMNLENTTISNNISGSRGGGIYTYAAEIYLSGVNISNNSAESRGGGIAGSTMIFNSENRSNIYSNSAQFGNDLYNSSGNMVNVIVDTFTVMNPTNYHAYPINSFTFDILNSIETQVEADLFVSPDGDNANSGLSWNDPLQTISYALSIISANSENPRTIFLHSGIYSSESNGESFPILCISWVSIIGMNEETTILDADQEDNIIYCMGVEGVNIENVTMTNGQCYYQGGGIFCEDSNMGLVNVTVSDCESFYEAGGIYHRNSSSIFDNVAVINNTAKYIGGISSSESIMTINDSDINFNNSDESAGGISCNYGETYITSTNIIGNVAGSGGGIFCGNSNPILTDVLISENMAGYGGGITCIESTPELENVTISYNNAVFKGGGIIFYENSNLIFSEDNRCNIYLNNSPLGSDLYSEVLMSVIVDTFTVMTPTGFYASPITNFTFDIQHSMIEQVNADLYVSPSGDDSNDGLSWDSPLKTVTFALSKILIDSLNQHTIFLSDGVFSPETNEEIFPIRFMDYITITGMGIDSTFINVGDDIWNPYAFVFEGAQNAALTSMTITNGYGIKCNNSSPILMDLKISDNLLYGIRCSNNSDPIVKSCMIVNNLAGIKCSYDCDPIILNTTIAFNIEDWNGGGLNCYENCHPVLVNSIIWNNYPHEIEFESYGDPCSVTISHCDIQDGENGIIIGNGSVNWLSGNINENPLFINVPVDYHLQENSPCIDAGTAFFEWQGNTLLDMTPDEYFGIAPDMGAYEWDGVSIEDQQITPLINKLHGNYPNPFNPETTISFHLNTENTEDTEINIFNIKGQKIRTIDCHTEPVEVGNGSSVYSVIWNGTDKNNQPVASGIYFYQLNVDDEVIASKKCLLLK